MKKIFFILLSFGFGASFVYADTFVSGYMTESQVWTKANSPYILNHVAFDVDTTLTIEAGTKVLFESEDALNIFGDIVVSGTDAEPVVFSLVDGAVSDTQLNIFSSLGTNITYSHFFGVRVNVYDSVVALNKVVIEIFLME